MNLCFGDLRKFAKIGRLSVSGTYKSCIKWLRQENEQSPPYTMTNNMAKHTIKFNPRPTQKDGL